MSDLIDWGYLTELYRETDKPIRKDENVFYEFSSAVFANFKHILKERETQAERLAELEAEVARLRKLLEPPKSWRDDPELEAKAKAIYETWKDQDGWVPWVAYGNSTKQDEARAAAQKEPS